jgi:hypothetical protein
MSILTIRYPPDDERFVERQTSVQDWPVFSDYTRVIRVSQFAMQFPDVGDDTSK